jgi:hypothetical protein
MMIMNKNKANPHRIVILISSKHICNIVVDTIITKIEISPHSHQKIPCSPAWNIDETLNVLDRSCLQNKVLQKIRGANIDFHCQTWMLSVFLTRNN